MQMPADPWRSLELASVLMGVDADLTLPLVGDNDQVRSTTTILSG